MTVLHLVRHGQSTWNVEGRLQGQNDLPELTDRGREEAAAAAAAALLQHGENVGADDGDGAAAAVRATAGTGTAAGARTADGPVVRLLTSDLTRARQTAEIIGAALGLEAISSSLLREQDLGEWEGLTTTEAMQRHAALGQVGPDDLLGRYGESNRDVYGRIAGLLASPLVSEATGPVVLVSHGDTIRWALAHLLGDDLAAVPWRDVPNGSVTTVRRSNGVIVAITRSPGGTVLTH